LKKKRMMLGHILITFYHLFFTGGTQIRNAHLQVMTNPSMSRVELCWLLDQPMHEKLPPASQQPEHSLAAIPAPPLHGSSSGGLFFGQSTCSCFLI